MARLFCFAAWLVSCHEITRAYRVHPMPHDLRKILDAETEERLKPLRDKFRHGQSFEVREIFSAPSVPESLGKESVFLHAVRSPDLLPETVAL